MCCDFQIVDKSVAKSYLHELALRARRDGGLSPDDQHVVWHLCRVACVPVGKVALFLLDCCCQPFGKLVRDLTHGRVSGRPFKEIADWFVDNPSGVKSSTAELMTV